MSLLVYLAIGVYIAAAIDIARRGLNAYEFILIAMFWPIMIAVCVIVLPVDWFRRWRLSWQ